MTPLSLSKSLLIAMAALVLGAAACDDDKPAPAASAGDGEVAAPREPRDLPPLPAISPWSPDSTTFAAGSGQLQRRSPAAVDELHPQEPPSPVAPPKRVLTDDEIRSGHW
jgi:hypothetical protein